MASACNTTNKSEIEKKENILVRKHNKKFGLAGFFRLSRVIGNNFLGLMQLKATCTCIINVLFKFDSVHIHSVF